MSRFALGRSGPACPCPECARQPRPARAEAPQLALPVAIYPSRRPLHQTGALNERIVR